MLNQLMQLVPRVLARHALSVGADGRVSSIRKRRQTRGRFKTDTEVIDAYAKIKTQVRDGTYVGRSTLSVERVCGDWLAGRRKRKTTSRITDR